MLASGQAHGKGPCGTLPRLLLPYRRPWAACRVSLRRETIGRCLRSAAPRRERPFLALPAGGLPPTAPSPYWSAPAVRRRHLHRFLFFLFSRMCGLPYVHGGPASRGDRMNRRRSAGRRLQGSGPPACLPRGCLRRQRLPVDLLSAAVTGRLHCLTRLSPSLYPRRAWLPPRTPRWGQGACRRPAAPAPSSSLPSRPGRAGPLDSLGAEPGCLGCSSPRLVVHGASAPPPPRLRLPSSPGLGP